MLENDDNELFPVWQSYDGWAKALAAFKGAETSLQVEKTKSNILPLEFFFTESQLYNWTVTHAGGNVNLPDAGLDWNVAIISAIDDVDWDIEPLPAVGFTYHREQAADGSHHPARAYVMNQRIRDQLPWNDYYSQTANFTGTGVHELGHARELDEADHSNHSGSYQNSCITWDNSLADIVNIKFCDGHEYEMKNVTW